MMLLCCTILPSCCSACPLHDGCALSGRLHVSIVQVQAAIVTQVQQVRRQLPQLSQQQQQVNQVMQQQQQRQVAQQRSATPAARVAKNKVGCPACAISARPATDVRHPAIAEDPVLHQRNADHGHFPDTIRRRSNKQIFWLCNQCPAGQQHSWSATPNSRTGHSQTGCSMCAGHSACACNSLQALHPSIAAEWDPAKNKGQPSDYPSASVYLAWWCSPQHGSWQQTIKSRAATVRRKAAISKVAQQRLSAASPP